MCDRLSRSDGLAWVRVFKQAKEKHCTQAVLSTAPYNGVNCG
jgi:hypothetical protein